jgi:hypothetical protein
MARRHLGRLANRSKPSYVYRNTFGYRTQENLMAINLKAITSCLGYQQIASLSTAQALTVPSLDPVSGLNLKPTLALITPESVGVRWRDDGVAPTGAIGMPLAAGVTLQYDGDLSKIRFIEQSASAKLNISYYA